VRKLGFFLLVVCAGVLLYGSVTAGETEYEAPQWRVVKAASDPMGIVKFARKFPTVEGPRPPMPVPIEPLLTLSRDAITGPVTMTGGEGSVSFGSALLAPRGAAMSSPQELAEREIRKLIRRLD